MALFVVDRLGGPCMPPSRSPDRVRTVGGARERAYSRVAGADLSEGYAPGECRPYQANPGGGRRDCRISSCAACRSPISSSASAFARSTLPRTLTAMVAEYPAHRTPLPAARGDCRGAAAELCLSKKTVLTVTLLKKAHA